jgi:hypothetical protein
MRKPTGGESQQAIIWSRRAYLLPNVQTSLLVSSVPIRRIASPAAHHGRGNWHQGREGFQKSACVADQGARSGAEDLLGGDDDHVGVRIDVRDGVAGADRVHQAVGEWQT